MPRPKPKPAAALARELHAASPALSPAQIAAELSRRLRRKVSRQAVADALAQTSTTIGRPRRAPQTERVHLTMDAAILARVRAEGERSGYSVAELLEGAWLACESEDSTADLMRAAIERARAGSAEAVA